MKAIAFNRDPGMPVRVPPAIDIIADSALVSAGRPMFLPDFSDTWAARFYVAYRISRLGKDIAPKFAPRYYDAFTIAVRLVPEAIERVMGGDFRSAGVLGVFDYCLGTGEWGSLPDFGKSVNITAGGMSLDIPGAEINPDAAISVVSGYSTLKTGDIVMPCMLPAQVSVKAGDDVSVTVDSRPCLDFRIR